MKLLYDLPERARKLLGDDEPLYCVPADLGPGGEGVEGWSVLTGNRFLRLTAEGYRVWCSRFPVLGGERYPRDIAAAIRERAFRVLALLSRASLSAPAADPARQAALAGAREDAGAFVIGLLADEADAIGVDVAAGRLPHVPFQDRWETGLTELLIMLRALGTPRPLVNGAEVAAEARRFLSSRRSWHTEL